MTGFNVGVVNNYHTVLGVPYYSYLSPQTLLIIIKAPTLGFRVMALGVLGHWGLGLAFWFYGLQFGSLGVRGLEFQASHAGLLQGFRALGFSGFERGFYRRLDQGYHKGSLNG